MDFNAGVINEKHGTGVTIYILSTCKNCGATVTITSKIRTDLCSGNSLRYFDENIPCCKKPDYFHSLK